MSKNLPSDRINENMEDRGLQVEEWAGGYDGIPSDGVELDGKDWLNRDLANPAENVDVRDDPDNAHDDR